MTDLYAEQLRVLNWVAVEALRDYQSAEEEVGALLVSGAPERDVRDATKRMWHLERRVWKLRVRLIEATAELRRVA